MNQITVYPNFLAQNANHEQIVPLSNNKLEEEELKNKVKKHLHFWQVSVYV